MRRCHIIVKGLVQGVCFRYYTQAQAQRLGLNGWVRNRPDGAVEIMAEGDTASIDKLTEWSKSGPPQAEVAELISEDMKYTGELIGFDITY